jgi:GTP cyclohydrolase IA
VASRRVSWAEVYERLRAAPAGRLFGVPRGGAIVAGLTGRAVDDPRDADWIVDDVARTGATLDALMARTSKPGWALFDVRARPQSDSALVMPWDARKDLSTHGRLVAIGRELLEVLGYDPSCPGLVQTPDRWARWWQEFHTVDPAGVDVTFDAVTSGQLVAVSGVRVWSLCEHHLLPFVADVTIAYVPNGRILGLSKFARIAQRAGRRLQLQERLTEEIASCVERVTASPDLGVIAIGRHLCMEARGVRSAGRTSTVALRGALRTDPSLRSDLYRLAGVPSSTVDPWLGEPARQ